MGLVEYDTIPQLRVVHQIPAARKVTKLIFTLHQRIARADIAHPFVQTITHERGERCTDRAFSFSSHLDPETKPETET